MSAVYIGPMVTSASTVAPEVYDFEPTVEQIEAAVTQVINGTARGFDSSVYIQWLCTQGELREPSKDFGLISTDELLMLLANPDSDAATCKQIGSEIRRRFTDAHLEGITKLAEQLTDAAEEACFERRFCRG